MNKTKGPNDQLLFQYSAEPPEPQDGGAAAGPPDEPLSTVTDRAAKAQVDIKALEGASDDPNLTKVVDRRWYERNKHIYPASTWQAFDPEKDYHNEVRRDLGGNAFFYS